MTTLSTYTRENIYSARDDRTNIEGVNILIQKSHILLQKDGKVVTIFRVRLDPPRSIWMLLLEVRQHYHLPEFGSLAFRGRVLPSKKVFINVNVEISCVNVLNTFIDWAC